VKKKSERRYTSRRRSQGVRQRWQDPHGNIQHDLYLRCSLPLTNMLCKERVSLSGFWYSTGALIPLVLGSCLWLVYQLSSSFDTPQDASFSYTYLIGN